MRTRWITSIVVAVATGCFPGLRRPRPVCPVHPAIVATSTTGALEVHVIDKARSEPVVEAIVAVADLEVRTDSCGVAVISGVAPGRYDLQVVLPN